jgi:(1->4)-alpha-D-glucan 1-alpha-D-glucosylmutase
MQIPRATYRFQFNEHFRLPDALALVPYLHELGISHIYASPLFKAALHSTHGYDVCDFTQLNPELGSEADLEKLVAALHEKKMGLVLDIVPNHMGIGTPENISWWDVLTHGEKSKFAHHFDIDWESSHENLRGKIFLPILGDDYETLLNKGEFQLLFENKKHVIGYHEHRFPLAHKTIAKLPTDAGGLKKFNSDFAALDKLIRQQNYQLAFHEHGDVKLNYRRFFAVSSLAAVRVDDEKVFNATHVLIRRWIEKGWLDGLRVDHPDGLRDPEKYLQRLRAIAPDAWIVVEKILEPEELLPESWPVAGTTGYDFLNQLNGLFIDANSEKVFTDFYAEFTGEPTDYVALVRKKKRAVLKTLFIAELNRLTRLLTVVAAQRKAFQRIPRAELQDALAEIIVHFPVYRSYISEVNGVASAVDTAVIKAAIHLAYEARTDLSPSIFAFIHTLLLKPQRDKLARNFIARFQQLTGPVMAKGVEDTAFYCFNRFTSLNEVGGDPKNFGVSLEMFHKFLQQQQKNWPHSQLTTSTHDTKRAEDVRSRLNVISEIPEIWIKTVRRWSKINERHRQYNFPDRNAEYLFYQTLAGAWPLPEARAQFYMEKAAHESKQHTTWTKRNASYEKALKNFISKTSRDRKFMGDFKRFVGMLSEAAAVNSLAQTLIKLTAPGVPDIYQGCELWDWSTVDPDNRRPVDFELRRRLLAETKSISAEKIWKRRAEGLPKLWLMQKTLKLRERFSGFSRFNYKPIFAGGPQAENVVAFARGGKVITIVPRFVLKLNKGWQDTSLELPSGNWRNEFTGENFGGKISVKKLFQKFPVALLVKKEDD